MLRVAADGTSSAIGAQPTQELIEFQKRFGMPPGESITRSYSGSSRSRGAELDRTCADKGSCVSAR